MWRTVSITVLTLALYPYFTLVVIAWLSSQLAKQKKTDFRPRNDDLTFARVNTEPCMACCGMLETLRDAAKKSLSGKNLEVFLTEIGVAFHGLLLEHLRKFPVNDTGGIILAKSVFWQPHAFTQLNMFRQGSHIIPRYDSHVWYLRP